MQFMSICCLMDGEIFRVTFEQWCMLQTCCTLQCRSLVEYFSIRQQANLYLNCIVIQFVCYIQLEN